MTLKWKREKPGCYVSGVWKIKGSGTSWELFHQGEKVSEGNSKKCVQIEAQQFEDNPDVDPEPNEETTVPSVVVESRPKKTSNAGLDGILSSLRLEIDNLSHRIDAGTAATNNLTDAILMLVKHLKK